MSALGLVYTNEYAVDFAASILEGDFILDNYRLIFTFFHDEGDVSFDSAYIERKESTVWQMDHSLDDTAVRILEKMSAQIAAKILCDYQDAMFQDALANADDDFAIRRLIRRNPRAMSARGWKWVV